MNGTNPKRVDVRHVEQELHNVGLAFPGLAGWLARIAPLLRLLLGLIPPPPPAPVQGPDQGAHYDHTGTEEDYGYEGTMPAEEEPPPAPPAPPRPTVPPRPAAPPRPPAPEQPRTVKRGGAAPAPTRAPRQSDR